MRLALSISLVAVFLTAACGSSSSKTAPSSSPSSASLVNVDDLCMRGAKRTMNCNAMEAPFNTDQSIAGMCKRGAECTKEYFRADAFQQILECEATAPCNKDCRKLDFSSLPPTKAFTELEAACRARSKACDSPEAKARGYDLGAAWQSMCDQTTAALRQKGMHDAIIRDALRCVKEAECGMPGGGCGFAMVTRGLEAVTCSFGEQKEK